MSCPGCGATERLDDGRCAYCRGPNPEPRMALDFNRTLAGHLEQLAINGSEVSAILQGVYLRYPDPPYASPYIPLPRKR